MWSAAFDVILTTLRYLAPATLLTLFWGQQGFLFRILKNIDLAIRTIVFSSDEQKASVLKWLEETGSVRIEELDTVWRHGWILCGVLDAALPGACAGHPPTRLSLKHAQTIADHYLGVEPVFSRQELESNDCLSRHQEWKLAHYLDRIRQAMAKIPPPVSKPNSQRTSPETPQYTTDYVARGSGLTAAQIHNKTYFKIYPTAQQSLEPGEITILIRGPKDMYGMALVPPILGKAQQIRQNMLNLPTKPHYTENTLPITQGTTYMRSYGRNDMSKTYHIPKSKYNIEIDVESHESYCKIGYCVNIKGKYEISIVSRGLSIVGSPFTVTASQNILTTLERDSFSLEDGEEIDILDIKTDRKVVLRIVDFVTEKMLLKDNGVFEKITDEEAKALMSIENKHEIIQYESSSNKVEKLNKYEKFNKFKEIAMKVSYMLKVCKVFRHISMENKLNEPDEVPFRSKSRLEIPDIVNSTLNDIFSAKYNSKYIDYDNDKENEREPNVFEDIKSKTSKIDSGKYSVSSPSNPFLDTIDGNIYNSENNTEHFHVSESPQLDVPPIQIFIEENEDSSPTNTNPFIESEIVNIERPKTPILKIITGQVKNRDDSVYVDKNAELISDDILQQNEFINPLFIHQHQVSGRDNSITDFIIGAPVSLPPVIKASSPDSPLESIMITATENISQNEIKNLKSQPARKSEIVSTIFSTPLHTISGAKSNGSSQSQSLESSVQDTSSDNENNFNHYKMKVVNTKRDNISPKIDIWDSAYVSIDDTNNSPDNNNNDNATIYEFHNKPVFSTLAQEDFSTMGPAEKELWKTCTELTNISPVVNDDVKFSRWETKRPFFTPIIEESDRSLSTGMKDSGRTTKNSTDTDAVTAAFAELNDIFQEYGTFEHSSVITHTDDKLAHTEELKYTGIKEDTEVESASDVVTDVVRPTKNKEGAISEVQVNVTESVSVSQALHSIPQNFNAIHETHFGETQISNIVIEKKRYWDERIREIEKKKSEEPKRKKVISKTFRHNDSLTRRKGKQFAKNYLAEERVNPKEKDVAALDNDRIPIEHKISNEIETNKGIKLVNKWKKYWDEKFESDREESPVPHVKVTKDKNQDPITPVDDRRQASYEESIFENSTLPVKQELPEEVFKAFETSPKRFFGTSRKQILNKIDSFLGSLNSTTSPSTEVNNANLEKGIVSSRISLFHNISNVEEVVWKKPKSSSMHNINTNSDSEKYTSYQPRNYSNTPTLTTSFDNNNTLMKEYNNDALSVKRLRLSNNFNKSLDESIVRQKVCKVNPIPQGEIIKEKTCEIKKEPHTQEKRHSLQKSTVSKSEMDIFGKMTQINTDDHFDKHKSYDELPKTSVKNFIMMYENVSRKSESKPTLRLSRTSSIGSDRYVANTTSSNLENGKTIGARRHYVEEPIVATERKAEKLAKTKNWFSKTISQESIDNRSDSNSSGFFDPNRKEMQTSYLSLSDIELEIVENPPEKQDDPAPEKDINDPMNYKSRFKRAKQFFQSLEDVTCDNKKPRKLNECEQILLNNSTESLDGDRPQKRVKKNIKSHSMPSSELSKIWNEMQVNTSNESKLMKISEKFNVDDLFADVTEGKLSRQGSLRGIPHKKAVLETFKSMENLFDAKLSSYELAVSSALESEKENAGRNAQTYLSEYPYLPTTDPSRYRSRLDTNASGLISMKELLQTKPRRNSVPDIRLNAKFTVDL